MLFDSSEDYIFIYKIKNIISGILNKKCFDEVKEFINKIEVKLDEEEIKKYLKDRLIAEKPDLVKKVKKRKNKNNSNKIAKEFVEDLQLSAYSFHPFTLEYYENYISILKKKILKMINILDQIEDKDNKEIFDLLEDLDITIDDNRKIKKEDAERLLHTILYNLSDLLRKFDEANNLETYYNYKLTRDSLYRDGLVEDDLYPSENIQEKNLLVGSDSQFIPLTNKQKEMIRENDNKKNKYIFSLINQILKEKEY